MKIGLVYNLEKHFAIETNAPSDISSEWCSEEYIQIVTQGLREAGYEVLDIGEPQGLLEAEVREDIDIVFSLAEMVGYRYREILVPSLCELCGLPYLFAAPDAMMVTADKDLSCLYVKRMGIPVPTWYLQDEHEPISGQRYQNFPYIVKPNAEGSSMGISKASVVYDLDALRQRVAFVHKGYRQPAIVQEFVQGQEITVGVIQIDGKTTALQPLQTFDEAQGAKEVFDSNHKRRYKQKGLFNPLSSEPLIQKVRAAAERIFDGIGCKDAARIDFRVLNGEPHFIEINGLTDFHPDGAFCVSGKFAGLDYTTLLNTIVEGSYQRQINKKAKTTRLAML